jgi:hypothetical protein
MKVIDCSKWLSSLLVLHAVWQNFIDVSEVLAAPSSEHNNPEDSQLHIYHCEKLIYLVLTSSAISK